MTIKLFLEAIIKYIVGVLLVGLLIFVPAGTFDYYYGWLFMAVLFVPMFIAGIIMMILNPKLLRRRLNAKEKESDQKEVLLLSAVMFILGFISAGLNYRFSILFLNSNVSIIGAVIFLLSYIMYGIVLIENSYLLRTIEVEKNQKLIDTDLTNGSRIILI